MATIQDIQYNIVKLDTTFGRIEVQYKTAKYTQGLIYTIDLPIENGVVPTGDALDTLIMQFAPVGQLTEAEGVVHWETERKAVVNSVNFSEIEKLVVPIQVDQPTVTGTQTL